MNQDGCVIVRECEECHVELMDTERRRRCKSCKRLVCTWCFYYLHSLPRAKFTRKLVLRNIVHERDLCI